MSLGASMQCSVCDGYLEGGTERSRCRCQRADVRDPGREAADKILDGLEEFVDPPAEVARKARRLRAHIEALREPEFADIVAMLADTPLSTETPGVAPDCLGDTLVIAARAWVAAREIGRSA